MCYKAENQVRKLTWAQKMENLIVWTCKSKASINNKLTNSYLLTNRGRIIRQNADSSAIWKTEKKISRKLATMEFRLRQRNLCQAPHSSVGALTLWLKAVSQPSNSSPGELGMRWGSACRERQMPARERPWRLPWWNLGQLRMFRPLAETMKATNMRINLADERSK